MWGGVAGCLLRTLIKNELRSHTENWNNEGPVEEIDDGVDIVVEGMINVGRIKF